MVFKYGHTIVRKAQVSGLNNNTMHMYHKSRYRARKRYYEKEENKEDWKIVNELANLIKRKKLFNDKNELNESMINYLKSKKVKVSRNSEKNEFVSEEILVEDIDYYYSNVISRASTTMTQCRNEKLNLKKNGTEG